MELEGRVSLITGAGAGIGRAIALKLAREGATVIVNDYDLKKAEETAAEIAKTGGKAIACQADVSDRKKVFSMASNGREKFGPIDILINNAGVGSNFLIEEMPPEVWDKNIGILLTGGFNCVKAVVGDMIAQKWGKIVFIASVASHRTGGRGASDYIAGKHGVLGFMRALAYELGRYNINVNAVCPGATLTDMLRSAQSPEVIESLKNDLPLGEICTPEDMAEATFFLVSDKARRITGHSLDVESGTMLSSGSNYRDKINAQIELSKQRVAEREKKNQ